VLADLKKKMDGGVSEQPAIEQHEIEQPVIDQPLDEQPGAGADETKPE
jgi:hypothetical protein